MEFFVGAVDCGERDTGGFGASGISGDASREIREEEVADNGEVGGEGRPDVAGSIGDGGVSVVNNEGLFGFETGVEEYGFAGAGAEHIEVETDVGGEEPLLVEGRFAGGLDAGEEDHVHGRDQTVKLS